jgi:large subunit ribosomal protein L6
MSTEAAEAIRVPMPKGSTLSVEGRRLVAKGPRGAVSRSFPSDLVRIAVSADAATLTLLQPSRRRRDRALLGTWAAHVRNLTLGVTQGFEAKMKVVAAHFPMKVQAKGSELLIENFLGEKHPRTAHLIPGVTASVDGDFVLLEGHDVEQVGQSAANIERTTRIRDYDPRVFQDGIFLVERAHPKGGGG